MRLPLSSVHDSPPKDTLQLFGVWWGDGVATDGQLHQGQAHAPHVGLNGVVSALQSLRLLRNTQPTSAGGRQSQDARQRERGRERGLRGGLGEREAQEAEERMKARGGGCYGKELVRVWRGKEDGRAWQASGSSYTLFLLTCDGRTGVRWDLCSKENAVFFLFFF